MGKKKKPLIYIILLSFLMMEGCQGTPEKEKNEVNRTQMISIEKTDFGKTPQGQSVELFTLTNQNGLRIRIMTYGAIVVSLEVPDRHGKLDDIVLGYDELDGYISNSPYFGAIVGRYGNRIAKGRFKLNGKPYQLAVNNGENHLHGGIRGFDKVVWKAETKESADEAAVELRYVSADGEEGYPGTLDCRVTYILNNWNEMIIRYYATTDSPTIINLTHHSYFNLAGQGKGDILGHQIRIAADNFTPVDEGLIPTGEIRPVEGTPMDFRTSTTIGSRIAQEDQQLLYGGGYDHNWALNSQNGALVLAAEVFEPETGRLMQILTTEPGLQFYSGNFLDGTITGKNGAVYGRRYGFCLETQHFPDSPNRPEFPPVVLNPGVTYTHETIHRFSAR